MVQIYVDHYKTVKNETWRAPDGVNKPYLKEQAVTQVSDKDPIANCKKDFGLMMNIGS